MKNTTELQLQKLALVLTAVLVLQVLWGGIRLLLLSDPDPIFPAEASLRVDDVRYGVELGDEQSQALVSRPVFWQGRRAYVPPDDPVEIVAPVEKQASKAINEVTLLGMYTGANPGIIILYDGERRRMRPGESVEDWKFKKLLEDGVIFKSKKERRTLHLEHALIPAAAADDTNRKDANRKDTNRKDTNRKGENRKGENHKKVTTNNHEKPGE